MSREEMLLGHWKVVQTLGSMQPIMHIDLKGYEFMRNNICDNKVGYYNPKEYKNGYLPYYSSYSKYKFITDSLKIYNPAYKRWDSFKIEKLSQDTLALSGKWESKDEYLQFTKQEYNADDADNFDEIIVSSSGCYGSCPVNDVLIKKNGNVEIMMPFENPDKAFYTSQISKDRMAQIIKDFKIARFDTLRNNYSTGVTDHNTTSVTFLKEGKILKSISDYANSSPIEFIWAYRKVNELYKELDLKPKKVPEYLVNYSIGFKSNNKIMYLAGSEKFYLIKQLQKGNFTTKNFMEIYSLSFFKNDNIFKIASDGRYYKFYFKNGNFKTIDIGYNFLKENKFVNKFEKL